MKNRTNLLSLFIQFLKFGFFTFGGGWSIVSQMQKVYVEQSKLITNEELLDMTSVGKSLPGVMVVNISMLFGYHQAGTLGALACVFGLALPPMGVLAVIAACYSAFQSSVWVASAMAGIRTAVVPIILSAALPMMKGIFSSRFGLAAAGVAFTAYLFFGVSCIWIVLGGAVLGLTVTALSKKEG